MIKILKKPSHRRTDHDLQQLIPFMKDIKFFQERAAQIKNQDYPDVVQSLQHEEFDDGEYVMHWGELGDKFYIILKGQVKVLVPTPRIKDSKLQMQDLVDELGEFREHQSELD